MAAGYLPYFARQTWARDVTFGSDFTVFYTGWSLVLGPERERLYDAGVQRAAQARVLAGERLFPGGLMAYVSPPHAAVLLAPLGLPPRPVVLWAWTALSAALLALLARALSAAALGPGAPRAARWLFLSALLAFRPIYETLQLGQLSIALGLGLWGVWVAVRDRDDRVAVASLVVLGLKPQLLPVAYALLFVFARWRALLLSSVALAAAAAVGAAVLGWDVWLVYARALPALEAMCGAVTTDHMLCLRGPLAAALGPEHPAVLAIALGAQAAALAAFAALARARRWAARAPALTFALGAALGLLFDAHIFMLDALLWVVPLVLYRLHLREAGRPTVGFDRFALAWPALFMLHELLEHSAFRPPVALALVVMAVLSAVIARTAARLPPGTSLP